MTAIEKTRQALEQYRAKRLNELARSRIRLVVNNEPTVYTKAWYERGGV